MLQVSLVYAAGQCKFLVNEHLNGESASTTADELLLFLVFMTTAASQNI
jgi:hypothetical protein